MSKQSLEYRQEAYTAARNALGISAREERRYSISRALLGAGIEGGKLSGYEGEIDQQVRAQSGKTGSTNNSFMLPTGLVLAQRDMQAGTDYAGGHLVATQNMGSNFIELLRGQMVATKAGAQFLPGLKGDVTIPKQTAGATAYWVIDESSSITESNQTLGQLALKPKTVGAYTEFSRQLLLQSSPSVDQMIANDLAKVVALAIDAAVFSGTGADGQPQGIRFTTGIGEFDAASCNLAKILAAQADIANSLDSPGVAYVTTAAAAAALMQRFTNATYGSDAIWKGNVLEGQILGTRALSSSAVDAGRVYLGDFSQVVVGEWGHLEIATNPFANFAAGIIGCRAMQSVDIGVRQAGAFTMATNFS